jgi:hypothetical protein
MARGSDAASGRRESFALHHITGVGVLDSNGVLPRATEREEN